MSEWGIALIAAGSAVAGSIVTGWFTKAAGTRQAAAARHAGDRQADALMATVQATLDEQRRSRALDLRRQIYLQFVEAADLPRRNREERGICATRMEAALTAIDLEGPESVRAAAHAYQQEILVERQAEGSRVLLPLNLGEMVARRFTFIRAARAALDVDRAAPATYPDPYN